MGWLVYKNGFIDTDVTIHDNGDGTADIDFPKNDGGTPIRYVVEYKVSSNCGRMEISQPAGCGSPGPEPPQPVGDCNFTKYTTSNIPSAGGTVTAITYNTELCDANSINATSTTEGVNLSVGDRIITMEVGPTDSQRTIDVTVKVTIDGEEKTYDFTFIQSGSSPTPSSDIYEIASRISCDNLSSTEYEYEDGYITVNVTNNTSDQLLWNGRLRVDYGGVTYNFNYRDPSFNDILDGEHTTTRYRFCNITNYILNCPNGGSISERYSSNVINSSFTYYLPVTRFYQAYKTNGELETREENLTGIVDKNFTNNTDCGFYVVRMETSGNYLKSDAPITGSCTYTASNRTLNVSIVPKQGRYSYRYNSEELKTFDNGKQALKHGDLYYPFNFSEFKNT